MFSTLLSLKVYLKIRYTHTGIFRCSCTCICKHIFKDEIVFFVNRFNCLYCYESTYYLIRYYLQNTYIYIYNSNYAVYILWTQHIDF